MNNFISIGTNKLAIGLCQKMAYTTISESLLSSKMKGIFKYKYSFKYDFKYHKTPITFQQEELFGVADDHPSKYGHQIIYESIVNHLKKYDV
jgi:hypothetical protein